MRFNYLSTQNAIRRYIQYSTLFSSMLADLWDASELLKIHEKLVRPMEGMVPFSLRQF